MPIILLVEDNEMNRDMLSRRLERRGVQVVAVETARQGIDAAGQQRPDLILMDLSLPEMDGLEATRRLKAQPATADIPIMALTAHALVDDRERALEAGCADFDTKPVDMTRLLDKMSRLLEPA
jgi:CheY-like chemotaxis protein